MVEAVHIEAIERLVSSIYSSGDHVLSSFMFGKPGAPIWQRSFGTEIYARQREYLDAVLYIRRNGSPYLRMISIGDLRSMITNFITENFWYIGGKEFPCQPTGAYSTVMSTVDRLALAEALASSPMFRPAVELTLYPLIPVHVADPYEGREFLLAAPDQLIHSHLPTVAAHEPLDPVQFPPFSDWKGRRRAVSSWLGVRSPLRLVSDKMASAILGAVALTLLSRNRYLFSGREVFGGYCTVSENVTVSLGGEAHTPPIMYDVTITAADQGWLVMLDALFSADDKSSRSKLRSLEYFYRAWFLDPRERFAPLCMSLDALLGVDHGHTGAAVKFIKNVIDPSIDETRLRLLMKVRGAVIHGAAPDVYDSENYERYWLDYGTDPIRDLELIVARCLRRSLFNDSLICHADPNAAVITEAQEKGRLPKVLESDSIIPADS